MSFIFLADVKAVYVALRTHNNKAFVKTHFYSLVQPLKNPCVACTDTLLAFTKLAQRLGPAQAADKDRVNVPGLSGASG